MSGLDKRRFRRLSIWYPASWRRAHGEILVAMMLDDAERAGRAAPSAAEIRAAVVHGLAARLGGPATVVIAAPGFYHAPQTIDDLVNFVVARCLDQLGIDQTLVSRWGR